MLARVNIPVGWLTVKYSTLICIKLGVRQIDLNEWEPEKSLEVVYLDRKTAFTFAQNNILDIVEFAYDKDTDILIHPDKLLRYGKRLLRSRLPKRR